MHWSMNGVATNNGFFTWGGHCSVLFEEGKCSENFLKGVALQICTVRNSTHIDRDE